MTASTLHLTGLPLTGSGLGLRPAGKDVQRVM
jgi:hypothetical protein